MIEFNRILLQLDKAVVCANSLYPQDKAIAIILFDNLIEIQLYKQVEKKINFDETTWFSGKRKFDKNLRKDTISKDGKYNHLLRFSKQNDIISSKDYDVLKYLHRIRNAVYHRGELNMLKLDFAIISYYGFISINLKKWGSPTIINKLPMDLPGFEEIDFGQGLQNKKNYLFDLKKYYNDSLDSIFTRLNIKINLNEKMVDIVSNQIEKIRWSIDFIKESKSINFYDVLSKFWYLNSDFSDFSKRKRKPKNLDSILIIYAFLREYKDYLDDIADLKERQKEGRKQLKLFRQKFKGKYPNWVNLDKVDEKLKSFKKKEDYILIQYLNEIEKRLLPLFIDTEEAAISLDGYIQSWLTKE